MSKTLKTSSINFEKIIMAKVKSNEISIKPRWYFVIGSLFTVTGLVGFSIGAVFLTNLTLFLLKRHGPMGQWRLQQLLTIFRCGYRYSPLLVLCLEYGYFEI
jgi:hypothetical protein